MGSQGRPVADVMSTKQDIDRSEERVVAAKEVIGMDWWEAAAGSMDSSQEPKKEAAQRCWGGGVEGGRGCWCALSRDWGTMRFPHCGVAIRGFQRVQGLVRIEELRKVGCEDSCGDGNNSETHAVTHPWVHPARRCN